MIYRKDKYGNDISVLGFGCMRFPKKGTGIDQELTTKLIKEAFDAGVNYYDTAYIYGGSEAALGEALETLGIRDQVKIATKLPHYLVKKADSLDKYFEEQIKRLRTDHVDYYLMHMLTDVATWERLKELGIIEWLDKRKKEGSVRQIGFSYHGNTDMFKQLLDAYDWDFAMVQYNYMDEHSQAGRAGVEYAHEKGVPVWIMEPLRGGKLVNNLPKSALDIFNNAPVKDTPAAWAFKWLFSQKEVTCVLSGMNSLEMLRANIKTASESNIGCMSEEDDNMLRDVAKAINSSMKVGCTGCAYCMPCPKGVDIPGTFSAYNRVYSEGFASGMKDYIMSTTLRKNPTVASNCVGCGKCEQHCPQSIEIRKELKNASKLLDNIVTKIVGRGIKLFRLY
ncbi:MAG: aldo/keto reductase [Lachnospiraceae bacterium]|nr:aldo/keto reductase [Lachnospiraceae bacterium]